MDKINPLIILRTIESLKYRKPSCARETTRRSQSAAEHMFRHALICLIIPVDGIDREKLVTMALIHNIVDFRTWNGMEQKKLNMDYLACNLPAETTNGLRAYWTEYWDGKTTEAQIAQEVCAFEHMVAFEEEKGIVRGDPTITYPTLQEWITFIHSSKDEMMVLQNGASLGSSYWDDPEKNMGLLAEAIKDNSASSPLPYIRMLRDMSDMKRRGWIKRGMDPSVVESNASHSWGVALICLLFSRRSIAFECAILGLIHDLGEIVIGDVIPSDDRTKGEKQLHERFGQEFLVHICLRSEMKQYFIDFETGKSIAAQTAHEADSLECRIQAVIYIPRYPQLKELLEFLVPPLKTAHFQDLTIPLSEAERSLREKQSQEKQSQLTIIFVVGGPGVGKDTLCNRLAKEFNFCHIPTGDLLRKEVERTSSRYSKFIQDSIDLGFNVPAELIISLMTIVAKGFKLFENGFPRNLDQLFTFEQLVSPLHSTLFLGCPETMSEEEFEEMLRARLQKRGTSSSRSDDVDIIIENRLRGYRDGKNLISCLQKRSLRFEKIDSTRSEEEVYSLAREAIKRLIPDFI